jgi:UDP-N-acetylmuramoylalanine--D-glutamate ligase
MIADFNGQRVTVMGLGSFGGGIGAVQFLSAHGAQVTVTDLKPAGELSRSLAEISGCAGVTQHLGEHRDVDFRDADLIVASPAVPRENRYLQIARDAGLPITSEMNLFWERNRGRTIGVTGSSGKSTTTALIYTLLSAGPLSAGTPAVPDPHFESTAGPPHDSLAAPLAGGGGSRVWLGGNIGKSLLPDVEQIQSTDWVVLELSSFQLADLAPLEPNPHVAVVTNFAPNHLDRHGSIDAYRAAKQNLLHWQTADRFAVLNQSDSDVAGWRTHARKVWFGREDEGKQGLFAVGFDTYKRRALFRFGPREQVLPLGRWLSLPGVHNFQNALAATCTALVLGSTPTAIERGLSGFRALPHRLEFVVETAERRFYDDSKATTPEAAILALESFRAPILLLAGGYDKGVDLKSLARAIAERRVKGVALLGQTGEQLKKHLEEAAPHGEVPAKVHVTLEAAFRWAAARSAPGDVVLLSPGCASYDWFPNYEARGDEFQRLARAWKPA